MSSLSFETPLRNCKGQSKCHFQRSMDEN